MIINNSKLKTIEINNREGVLVDLINSNLIKNNFANLNQ